MLQLQQELQRQQQCTEQVTSQLQNEQIRARASEEEHKALLSTQKNDNVALQNQVHSKEIMLQEKQNEISELIAGRRAALSKCDELHSKIATLENARTDWNDAMQAQISANARSTAEIRELRNALETQSSTQRDHFENELRRSRQASDTLQHQMDSVQKQSAEFAALCSSQQQSIQDLTQKMDMYSTERQALEMQLDLLRSRAQKHATLNQESQSQISCLSGDLSQARAKINELQLALGAMTSRYDEVEGALSNTVAQLEFKDSELKSTIKQARTKSLQHEESSSRLQDQYLQLQHEFSESTSRLQQQVLAAERSAASRASRIAALEEALTGEQQILLSLHIVHECLMFVKLFFVSFERSYCGSSYFYTASAQQTEQSVR